MHGQGASSINYSTIVFDFVVCRLLLPASLTNYGDGDASRLGWPAERRKKRLGSPSVINEKKHNDGHGNFIKPPARILLGKPVRLGVKQLCVSPELFQAASVELNEMFSVRPGMKLFKRNETCLVPVRRLPRPSPSMHFDEVSEVNGRNEA